MTVKTCKLAVIPGDGIGPEVASVAMEAMDKVAVARGIKLEPTYFPFGATHYLKTGETLSDESLAKLRAFDCVFLGAVGSPDVKPGILERGVLLKLRFAFDQYINLRPVKLYPGVECPIKGKTSADLDYVVVRENSGGLYSGFGGIMMEDTEDEVAAQEMVYTHKQVARCLRYAFALAESRPRKLLALIGKTNVLVYVFKLWEKLFRQIGEREFPNVKREYYHVDAACMHMITRPDRFDVMVTTNMFGDIITDLAAVTQGGMGMAASGNINPTRTAPSMFEPIHGSAPDIAGQNKANPLAAVMSVKMMFDFLGEPEAAETVDKAIRAVTTMDFNRMSTTDIKAALMKNL